MLEIIREIAPTYVVGENVRGLVNWSDGLVFEEVCADLEAAGYDVQPFILPAAGVNAPHRRDRVWFVAHANSGADLRKSRRYESESQEKRVQQRDEVRQLDKSDSVRQDATNANRASAKHEVPTRGDVPSSQDERDATDPNEFRLEHGQVRGGMGKGQRKTRPCVAHELETEGQDEYAAHTISERPQQQVANRKLAGEQRPTECSERPTWDTFPTQPPVCGGDDGLPRELDGITFSKWRNQSIKAYGNAIVPQVAYQIFQAINEHERAKTGGMEA
jgi:DNA (cytosine-5)-methyltransferase 1